MVKKLCIKYIPYFHQYFFYIFVAVFTLSVRKIIQTYTISGQFNEFTGIYLYLSDILLFLTILFWLISLLCNRKIVLSIENVPHGTIALLAIPAALVVWSFFSLFWTDNTLLGLFRSLKLAEFYLLYLYIIYNVPRGTFLKRLFQIVIASGIIQSIIAICQFIFQHTLGLPWLRESILSPEISGVAKLVFDGHKIIRAYGLFPHPNILGGFLVVSIIFTWAYSKLFHAEHNKPKIVPPQKECSMWNILRGKRGTSAHYWIIVWIQILASIMTFSKSAWLGLVFAVSFIAYDIVPHGTITAKMSILGNPARKVILVSLIALLLTFTFHPTFESFVSKSIRDRLVLLNVSRGTILTNSIFGIGIGQFVAEMQKYASTTLEAWQYQPVHNVFLLIWAETGIIGIMLFAWWLWKMFHVKYSLEKQDVECSTWNNNHCEIFDPVKANNVPRETFMRLKNMQILFKGLLLGFAVIMLFDHYPWDIQQGQIMFWLIAGLFVGQYKIYIDN